MLGTDSFNQHSLSLHFIFHTMKVTAGVILQDIHFCVSQMKVSHTGLEQHEGE